jgi:photosystem II stability/assembly factor-like uncharacterized protein
MSRLFIASKAGLFIAAQESGDLKVVERTLPNEPLTSVAAAKGVIVAGGTDGIRRSLDQGRSWERVNIDPLHIRWVETSESDSLVCAGTEPAGILVSRDSGRSWNPGKEVFALRDAHGWFLPYSPEAGCVRGFAYAKAATGIARIYAAVEVGGVLVSDDGGESWRLVEGSDGLPDFSRDLGTMIHPDVHSISVHPVRENIVTAPTGGGLYRSHDGGRTWMNMYACYIRAVWVDPIDPAHMIAGPAEGVSRNGRIKESLDGGKTWINISEHLRTPWPRHMVERFFHIDADLYAVLSNGALLRRSAAKNRWESVLEEIGEVKALASV